MHRILQDYPEISLKPQDLAGKIDFALLFGRSAPLAVEIGSGKGTFLVHQAKAQPDFNFLGIEWASRFYRYAVDRAGRRRLRNVRLIRTDAVTLIADFFPDSCVDFYHIYFPDPWPKKKHHKRRFICPENVEQLLRTLKPHGQIRIATDHEGYFEQIQNVFASFASKFHPIDFLPTASAQPGEFVGSNFERKYLLSSKTIFTLALQKS